MISLLYLLLIAAATFLIGTLAGYVIHRVLHEEWGGRFYSAHQAHHDELYPPEDFFSDEYRLAGKDDTLMYFLIPIALMALVLLIWMPFWYWAFMAVLVAVGGYAHEYLHTQFHLSSSWLRRFRWFCKLVDLHILHHKQQDKNMGIYSFIWDRVFGTYINWGDVTREGGK